MLDPAPSSARHLHDAAARRWLWGLGLSTAVLFALISWQLAPLQPDALALQFAYTPRAFGAIVHRWSPEQLAGYRAHLPLDALLLLGYGSFGWLLARRGRPFAGWPAGRQRAASWLLPLAACADAVENLFHWWLTGAPRFGVPWAYAASTAASSIKWVLLVAFAAAASWALATERE